MKKIILALVIGLVLSAAILINLSQNNDARNNTSTPTQTSANSVSSDTVAPKGAYIDYDSDVIAKTKGTKLLFFHAPWCPQCRALDADIRAKGLPEGLTIIKVDYDTNQSLRQKYGVTIQTTLVKIDDNGDLIRRYVAYDEPTLQSVKENLL